MDARLPKFTWLCFASVYAFSDGALRMKTLHAKRNRLISGCFSQIVKEPRRGDCVVRGAGTSFPIPNINRTIDLVNPGSDDPPKLSHTSSRVTRRYIRRSCLVVVCAAVRSFWVCSRSTDCLSSAGAPIECCCGLREVRTTQAMQHDTSLPPQVQPSRSGRRDPPRLSMITRKRLSWSSAATRPALKRSPNTSPIGGRRIRSMPGS